MKSVEGAGLRTRHGAACGRRLKAQPLLPEEPLTGEDGWEEGFSYYPYQIPIRRPIFQK